MSEDESFALIRERAIHEFQTHVFGTVGFAVPPVAGAADLLALARALAPADDIEQRNGWTTDPPFPGVTSEPQKHGATWMLFCASNLIVGGRPVAQLFLSLPSGRSPTLAVNGPAELPPGWKPLAPA